jgi:hypothetical protein
MFSNYEGDGDTGKNREVIGEKNVQKQMDRELVREAQIKKCTTQRDQS